MSGFLLNPFIFASGGAEELTYVNSATSTATTITIPSDAAIGDLAILIQGAYYLSTSNPSPPTNWTELYEISYGTSPNIVVLQVSYKILVSGDPNSSVTGLDGSISDNKVMLVFRPTSTISAVALTGGNGEATAANPTAQTLALTAGTKPLIGLAVYYSNGVVDPRTFTGMTPDGEATSSTQFYVKYIVINTADSPSDVTVDMDDEGVNVLVSGRIEVTL